jgi:2-C-methyl-D-erythritol 4-phosphate cytidylyltransferase
MSRNAEGSWAIDAHGTTLHQVLADDEIVWTIVVGGGRGARFGVAKQFQPLAGERVIDHARRAAEAVSAGVVVVVPPDDAEREGGVAGGETRSESVRAGLSAVPPDASIICVHDAARPLATAELFGRVCAAVHAGADAAVPAVPVTDTIKVVDRAGHVVTTLERSTLVAVQTPQAFRAPVLRRAHAGGDEGSDDATLVERLGGLVVTVAGEAWNRKITEPEDLDWAQRHLAGVSR